jgi:CubicO group peptidase (beta-lactamase class C family)
MQRRTFLQVGLGMAFTSPLWAAVRQEKLDAAADILAQATADRRLAGAVLHAQQGTRVFAKSFGAAQSTDAMFLLGSISKPISVAALMTLFDQGKFQLDDPLQKLIPDFRGQGREKITIRQLLTHVSGLPDQLPENQVLRSRQAKLSEFVEGAVRTPLLFEPGARYEYSSMGILLASEAARRISGQALQELIDAAVFQPIGMKHSALGLGRFKLEEMMPCQAEGAAPESGAGDPTAKDWDWNSSYWRKLGAPWGGVHASAPDVARFFAELLHAEGRVVRPETARLMIRNHNREGLPSRGLGFAVGAGAGSPQCSDKTFGHTGSTGTIAWADPSTDTICVVLTTLPGRAVTPHPRKLASDLVAEAVG